MPRLAGSMQRLAQQKIGESLLLALAGAFLAIPASFATVRLLVSFLPSMISGMPQGLDGI